ncbi:nucleic-acid-binding protein from transposon X-element [Trichonephila clavipes]|nr:nucleic-acid-binding protein from transposon X-element [Trichonephila clavipes]
MKHKQGSEQLRAVNTAQAPLIQSAHALDFLQKRPRAFVPSLFRTQTSFVAHVSLNKINKNYNLILQEIYRTYPNTVNKNTGNYIRIQPATAEDDENIKKLLIIKRADHYTVERPTVIKAVIKGLPSSTNIIDIETGLKAKGFDVEKIAQLRKFSTKSPSRSFMIQIKQSKNAQDIFKLKNLNYLTVEVVPFRRRPGASQCFNCNYFNHTSKNCKMTSRCLKCEGNHKTHDCPKTERLQTLKCINCNETGHLASSRQCPEIPKLKLKKSEEPKTINQTRPVTSELSYAKVCSNETEQQMAPRGETQNRHLTKQHLKITKHLTKQHLKITQHQIS